MSYPKEIFEVTKDIIANWEKYAVIVSHTVPFDNVAEALRMSSTPGAADKVVVTFADRHGLDLLVLNVFHEAMTRSADELVTEFCKLWSSPNPEELAGYFTEDAVLHNIPMDPVHGRDAIKQFIASSPRSTASSFNVHRQVSDGTLVMNERTDVEDGGEVPLPVMGVFEVRDGKIAAWRNSSTWRPSPRRSASGLRSRRLLHRDELAAITGHSAC